MEVDDFQRQNELFVGWRILEFPAEKKLDSQVERLLDLFKISKESEELVIKDLLSQALAWANEMNVFFWDTAKRLERRITANVTDETGTRINLSIRMQIIKKLSKGIDPDLSYRIFELRVDINDYVCKGEWRKVFDHPVALRILFLPGYETINIFGDNVTYYKYFISFFDKVEKDQTDDVLHMIHENYSEIIISIMLHEKEQNE